jgi:hypothetical protein
MSSCDCGIPNCTWVPLADVHLADSTPLVAGREVEVTQADGAKFKLQVESMTLSGTDIASMTGRLVREPEPEEEESAAAEGAPPAPVVYISGPMRGYPDHNYPAFHEAEELLCAYGYEVVNPARNFDGRRGLEQETYLREDVKQMAERCDSIYMLDGWRNSAGARLEYSIAKALGFQVINPRIEGDDLDVSDPVEYEASGIVRNGERQMNYGHPNQDFARTAGMWTAFLAHKLVPGEVITMEEMALMMGQLKMSRLASTPGHHDSIVDLIGYAICYDRLNETEDER